MKEYKFSRSYPEDVTEDCETYVDCGYTAVSMVSVPDALGETMVGILWVKEN